MITRQLTIQAEPHVQVTLYYNSRSNAEKPPVKGDGDYIVFEDDFNQKFTVNGGAIILCDLLVDGPAMFRAQAEMQVEKLQGAKKLQERIDGDPLLKVFLQNQQRQQQPQGRGMMMPPGIMPQA